MKPVPSSVCVFCGARFGTDPAGREVAQRLGTIDGIVRVTDPLEEEGAISRDGRSAYAIGLVEAGVSSDDVTERADGVSVTVRNLATGRCATLEADALVCATGYTATEPSDILGEVGALLRRDELNRL